MLAIVYFILYFLLLIYAAYSYIGMGLGGFRMARKIGMTNPWMFWIPLANAYAMGNLADQQASLCDGRSTTYRKKMLAWNIVIICAALLLVIAMVPILLVVSAHGTMGQDGTVTVRHRDTMAQERIAIEALHAMVDEQCSYRKLFKKLNQ